MACCKESGDWLFCVCCFFFKQKTAYEMRISDWSSDVCSSDLALRPRVFLGHPHPDRRARRDVETVGRRSSLGIHADRRPPLEHLSMSRTRIHNLSISDRKSTRLNSSH